MKWASYYDPETQNLRVRKVVLHLSLVGLGLFIITGGIWFSAFTLDKCQDISTSFTGVTRAEGLLLLELDKYYAFRDSISTDVDDWTDEQHTINGNFNLTIKTLVLEWKRQMRAYNLLAEKTPGYIFKILKWQNGDYWPIGMITSRKANQDSILSQGGSVNVHSSRH